jgi:hypothetical protein
MMKWFQVLLSNSTCATTTWREAVVYKIAEARTAAVLAVNAAAQGRGLHSSTFQLNLRFLWSLKP